MITAYQCHGSNVGPMGTLRTGHNEACGVPFVASTLNSGGNDGGFRTEPGEHLVSMPLKAKANSSHDESHETYIPHTAWCLQERDGKGPDSDTKDGHLIPMNQAVRRLTPIECERLQGFPDDWTRWGVDGKEISNSARYRMLGNAVTVNVAEWIGRRIMEPSTLTPGSNDGE